MPYLLANLSSYLNEDAKALERDRRGGQSFIKKIENIVSLSILTSNGKHVAAASKTKVRNRS